MTSCACGKQSWPSKAAADRVVVDSKIKAGLRGNTKRREQRSYPCPIKADLWHVTSQAGPSYDRAPSLPDYPDTDDEAATEFIADALRTQHDGTWAALTSDDRAEQTLRVLVALHQNILAQAEERSAAVNSAQSRRTVGEATHADVERARAEKAEWLGRVAHFRSAVTSRLEHTRQAVKALNVARSSDKNARENDAHRDALRLLTLAVTRHLNATPDPTEPDRRLWAWLTVLAVPHNDHVMSLADLVADRYWADTPDELRRTA